MPEATLQEQQSSLIWRLAFAYLAYRVAGKMPVAAGIAFAAYPVIEASFKTTEVLNARQG